MPSQPRLLSGLASGDQPFAIIRREDSPSIDVLIGTIIDVESLADIPLTGEEVVALVPFRQVAERGFTAHDDGAPLRCLIVRDSETLAVDDALAALPQHPADVSGVTIDIDDETYARTVQRVIDDEIGRGEGANMVIRRDITARASDEPAHAVLSWLRELLVSERGAYWTFAVHGPGISLVGATPERHVSVTGDVVCMNPISGTYRHPESGPSVEGMLDFLADVKESEELVMVVDEELKMMSAVCPDGGRMRGPFLKRMSRLTHTEFLLEGTTTRDLRDVLRLTMFAPTVTGSPMQNACRVISRHETTGRRYYSGVLARFTPTPGGYDLDAPILIRTAHLDDDGTVTVSAGATLVRHSVPENEVAETRVKASGVLSALGVLPRRAPQRALPDDPRFDEQLAARNHHLAPFWRQPQQPRPRRGLSALVVDAGDDFTRMLAHQLTYLGFDTRVVGWEHAGPTADDDLVVFGPGPGDPRSTDQRIGRLRRLISDRVSSGLPMLAVCLSHQILSLMVGLDVEALAAPRQGVQRAINVFGTSARIGFYNTFAAVSGGRDLTPRRGLEISQDAESGMVHALRGTRIASVQGHLESVLSPDGIDLLDMLISGIVVPEATPLPTQ
ncbi:chorismate-binding protein [Microbacterium sp. MPKO10]|uniref:chorismate-binding protein n=1 Tax=Microbacterium sp. MPKO10 TaxID=2989818 RepID=UPI0022363CA7|nr:chorismate-binding protein [Microbacterium sp. MPKO10]MCW4458052.1 chorismate-binding protein [Microbacterium sp. MPKO10]